MAVHIISFRIAYDQSYDDRRDTTVNAIVKEAKGGKTWQETTSFVLIESDKSAFDLAFAIYYGSQLDAAKDTLLVIDLTHNAYATRGRIEYPATLGSFFPNSLLFHAAR